MKVGEHVVANDYIELITYLVLARRKGFDLVTHMETSPKGSKFSCLVVNHGSCNVLAAEQAVDSLGGGSIPDPAFPVL